jgi:hypothetical protein
MTPEATGTVTQGVCPQTGVQQYLLPVVKELLSGTLTLMPKFQAGATGGRARLATLQSSRRLNGTLAKEHDLQS